MGKPKMMSPYVVKKDNEKGKYRETISGMEKVQRTT